MPQYLAFDFGAESGRAILGTISGGRLALEEIHRFPNTPVRLPTGLYWDTLRLFHEIRHGLAICAREKAKQLDGIGIDTWGVDFALLGPDGALVDNPRHYRDPRTNGMLKRVFEVVPREELFSRTGIQFMDINSLCQWYALKLNQSPALRIADKLLFMPDLFSYWLTGIAKCERSIASTSQFYDPRAHIWATDILDRLGLAASILPEIISTGSRLGTLLAEIADFSGLPADTPVYATAGHDTASAVAAVPASSTNWCYISSGTWSLMGVETDAPIINEDALALNFTNEVGAGGTIRLLKNIAGLWLLQECRRDWALKGREYSYEELTRLAAEAPPSKTILNPDVFLQPGHMPDQIVKYCNDTGQSVPEQPGPMCRTILESLAHTYKKVLDMLERLIGCRIETIHIVGGGSRNQLLNQLTADITRRAVIAGPSEATAAGNVLVQAIGSGTISGLEEARDVIRRSFPPQSFSPR